MHPQKILLNASRNPRGVKFVPLGLDTARSIAEIEVEAIAVGAVWIECHRSGGTVTSFPVRELTRHQSCGAHLIAFRAEELVRFSQCAPSTSLFNLFEADRALPRTTHQPRFLTPAQLRTELVDGPRSGIAPIDYSHRIEEIRAALVAARPERTGQIRSFLRSAQVYAADPECDVPEGLVFGPDAESDGRLLQAGVLTCPPIMATPLGSPRDEGKPEPQIELPFA